MNRENLHAWTVISESPMAAKVAVPAFCVMKELTISGRVFVALLKSLTVRKVMMAVKKAMNRAT